ncbi:MAG: hypothetical protein QG554_1726, partial [Pseudomonadota bacterium]|nr:hypothetical protein [Pseudomonadota bacterium]
MRGRGWCLKCRRGWRNAPNDLLTAQRLHQIRNQLNQLAR